MALEKEKKVKRPKRYGREVEEPKPKSDLAALGESIRENPVVYVAAVAFILVCLLFGILYGVARRAKEREVNSQFARALRTEDPGLRAEELAPLSTGDTDVADKALYMLGESAYQARNYDEAKKAFERLRQEYPRSSYVPAAVEGLGYIAENSGDYEGALALYTEVADKWPDTFIGKRQYLNMGRCQEQLKRVEEAVAAYRSQTEVFPNSRVAAEAKEALERFRGSHPELFPEPSPPAETPQVEESPGIPGASPGEAPQASEPVSEAPVAPGVPAEAPAEAGAAAPTAPAGPPAEAPAEPTVPAGTSSESPAEAPGQSTSVPTP